MSEHKYKNAYNDGYKAGKKEMTNYTLNVIEHLFYEEPNEKEKGYNEALADVSDLIRRNNEQ